MPTFKVKTEYIEKLKQLGVYDEWLTNVKANWDDWNKEVGGVELMIYIFPTTSFDHLIHWSFNWNNSPEGMKYWREISRR